MDLSIFYVDIENLQEIAKRSLINAVQRWPADFPSPGMIKLYVKADQTELWRIWSSHNIPALEVQVNGVQHYTYNGSKNSADISIAVDALSDLLQGRTKNLAIMSDDSDYATLFAAIKREICSAENSRVPFKWFMTDRPDTRSPVLRDFFPAEYVHIVTGTMNSTAETEHKKSPPNNDPFGDDAPFEDVPFEDNPFDNNSFDHPFTEEENFARVIIQKIPVGPFRSGDCKKIIKQYFPKHDLSKNDSALFGTQFLKVIWPFLEKYGVKSEKSSRGPRKYEMTEEAKKSVENKG
jgi:hypothetical protein